MKQTRAKKPVNLKTDVPYLTKLRRDQKQKIAYLKKKGISVPESFRELIDALFAEHAEETEKA